MTRVKPLKPARLPPTEADWQRLEAAFLTRENRRRKSDVSWRAKAAKLQKPALWSLTEKIWAAGLWDGEGHASASLRGGEFNCSLDQEDRTVLERFQAAVGGIGRISKPKRRLSKTGKMQLIYTWKISSQPNLEKLWAAIGPYLCTAKRDQFSRALAVPIVSRLRHDKPLPEGVLGVTVVR